MNKITGNQLTATGRTYIKQRYNSVSKLCNGWPVKRPLKMTESSHSKSAVAHTTMMQPRALILRSVRWLLHCFSADFGTDLSGCVNGHVICPHTFRLGHSVWLHSTYMVIPLQWKALYCRLLLTSWHSLPTETNNSHSWFYMQPQQ